MKTLSHAADPAARPLLRGVLGGGAERPGKVNLRLIRRAIRSDWLDAAPQTVSDALMRHCAAVAVAGHARNAIAAAWCIIEAARANPDLIDRILDDAAKNPLNSQLLIALKAVR